MPGLWGFRKHKRLSTNSITALGGLRKSTSTGDIRNSNKENKDSKRANNSAHTMPPQEQEKKIRPKSAMAIFSQEKEKERINQGNQARQTRPQSPPPLNTTPQPPLVLSNEKAKQPEDGSEDKKLSDYDHDLATKFSDFVVNDLELLLSMETQARMDAQARREEERARQQAEAAATRPRRLKFELPEPPRNPAPNSIPSAVSPPPTPIPIPASPSAPINNNGSPTAAEKKQQLWRRLMNPTANYNDRRRNSATSNASTISTTTAEEDISQVGSNINHSNEEPCSQPEKPMVIGSRVRLTRRPLPTYGFVRFIGPVDFAPGREWIGVELDSRVGKNDGSVKNKRYFTTDRDRGVFLSRQDLTVV
ncbi:hypothetical protein BCR43DRAFT_483866 [Syncephalastrum racemosum]|uniref:CAP-Gly domain-containing protein n=1 Tax=Syncephalastrum racemosum TaxID=13706 RepID=A0A1X2HW10_SYNRA|nr:hypothetical protein BCR43DRAFT_483866 [Syncephalastrum racemosum]